MTSSSALISACMSSRSNGVTKVASSLCPMVWLISSPRCSTSRISPARRSISSQERSIASRSRAPPTTFAASSTKRSKKRSSRGIRRSRTGDRVHGRDGISARTRARYAMLGPWMARSSSSSSPWPSCWPSPSRSRPPADGRSRRSAASPRRASPATSRRAGSAACWPRRMPRPSSSTAPGATCRTSSRSSGSASWASATTAGSRPRTRRPTRSWTGRPGRCAA